MRKSLLRDVLKLLFYDFKITLFLGVRLMAISGDVRKIRPLNFTVYGEI